MTLAVNLLAVVLIVAIIWWFWLSTATARSMGSNRLIEIQVENGVYSPARIEVPLKQPFTLRFIRKDASPCAEKVFFEGLDKSLLLPLEEPAEIELSLSTAGEYAFSCEMKMYQGSLLAKEII